MVEVVLIRLVNVVLAASSYGARKPRPRSVRQQISDPAYQ